MSRSQINNICQYFELGELLTVGPGGGFANQNFVVETAKGKYFLKISTEHVLEDVLCEIEYLKLLNIKKLPVPSHVSNKNGDYVFDRDGCLATVSRFIEGTHLNPLTIDTIAQIGQLLSTLHLIDTNTLMPHRSWWTNDYLQTMLDQAYRRFPEKVLGGISDRINALPDLDKSNLPTSIVHGDPWYENFLFNQSRLSAVVDWEECTINYPVFDLAYCAVHCCFPDDHYRGELWRALLHSYLKLRPLNQAEIEYFPGIVEWIACTNSLWHLLRSKNDAQPERTGFLEWYDSLGLEKLKISDQLPG